MTDICLDNYSVVIEKMIIQQCAPVILGIKTANLLILPINQCVYAERTFQDTELSLIRLCSYEGKIYYLLYQPYKLSQYIHKDTIYNYLSDLGYSLSETETIIHMIAYKYNKYMQEKKNFPHEIGLLLGYPLADVIKFIQYNGADYLYSGYWKVYENLTETLRIFWRYQRAKEILMKYIMHGGRIATVIRDIIAYE